MKVVWPCVTAVAVLWTSDAAAQWRGPFPPYGYPMRYGYDAEARLEVTPRETEVYVDGYFAGVVDDFDGAFQRLHVPPGERELVLYLNGYRTFRQKALFTPGRTLRVRHTMEKLGPGETAEPRPQGTPTAQPATPGPGGRGRPPGVSGGERRMPPAADRAAFGTLSLRIQPADAAVLIDDEPWQNPEGENRLAIDVAEGAHRVEIRKEGYKTYTTTVRVRRGDTVTLNVRLPREDQK